MYHRFGGEGLVHIVDLRVGRLVRITDSVWGARDPCTGLDASRQKTKLFTTIASRSASIDRDATKLRLFLTEIHMKRLYIYHFFLTRKFRFSSISYNKCDKLKTAPRKPTSATDPNFSQLSDYNASTKEKIVTTS